jgi:hypothetical protein
LVKTFFLLDFLELEFYLLSEIKLLFENYLFVLNSISESLKSNSFIVSDFNLNELLICLLFLLILYYIIEYFNKTVLKLNNIFEAFWLYVIFPTVNNLYSSFLFKIYWIYVFNLPKSFSYIIFYNAMASCLPSYWS